MEGSSKEMGQQSEGSTFSWVLQWQRLINDGSARPLNVDEKLAYGDFGKSWTTHFPNRLTNQMSRMLCLKICLLVEQIAARDALSAGHSLRQVHKRLVEVGIPREEFFLVEKETENARSIKE